MSLKITASTTGIVTYITTPRTAVRRQIGRHICCDVNIETRTDFRNRDKGENSIAIRNNKNQTKIVS